MQVGIQMHFVGLLPIGRILLQTLPTTRTAPQSLYLSPMAARAACHTIPILSSTNMHLAALMDGASNTKRIVVLLISGTWIAPKPCLHLSFELLPRMESAV